MLTEDHFTCWVCGHKYVCWADNNIAVWHTSNHQICCLVGENLQFIVYYRLIPGESPAWTGRTPRTPGLRDSESDSASKGGEDPGSDESDKAEWSEEERDTKVNTMMCPGPLMITMFPTGHMWPTAHQEGADGGDEVRQEAGQR